MENMNINQEAKKQNIKRHSIIHVQNAILSGLENILPVRETNKYVIAYEQKVFRVHYLLYKIAKELVKDKIADKRVDINIREDYRLHIKNGDNNTDIMKNVVVRIIPTRYEQYNTIYATFITFNWRYTRKGGTDETKFNISQCPMIANYNNLSDICYKKVASQVSGYGTHGLRTYIVLSPKAGVYTIGEHISISNTGKSVNELPITIVL